jgi:hypothetical protein
MVAAEVWVMAVRQRVTAPLLLMAVLAAAQQTRGVQAVIRRGKALQDKVITAVLAREVITLLRVAAAEHLRLDLIVVI